MTSPQSRRLGPVHVVGLIAISLTVSLSDPVVLVFVATVFFTWLVSPSRRVNAYVVSYSVLATLVYVGVLLRGPYGGIPNVTPRSLALTVGLGLLTTGLSFALVAGWQSILRKPRAECPASHCATCGYRVDNIPSIRCPECGTYKRQQCVEGLCDTATKELTGVKRLGRLACGIFLVAVGLSAIRLSSPLETRLMLNPYVTRCILYERPGHRTERTWELLRFLEACRSQGRIVPSWEIRALLGEPDRKRTISETEVWEYFFAPQHRRWVWFAEVQFQDGNLDFISWDNKVDALISPPIAVPSD